MKKEKTHRKGDIKEIDNTPIEKKMAILDKEITNLSEDFIGVEEYIRSIKNAINDGAEIVSLSSGYGGGKSSLCNILSKDKMFNKVSKVSLWDVIVDKDNKCKKTDCRTESNTPKNSERETNILNLYKSFLYQLSGSFHSSRYSNYVNKALNKTTTFLIYIQKAEVLFLVLFSSLYLR